MPYSPDKYYYALNKLEEQYARAVKGAHASAIREVYSYLERQKEALSPTDIGYILSAFGVVQNNLKPIVGQYALKSFQLGNTRISNLLSRGEQIPYSKHSLRSILDRNYSWVKKYGADREQILKQNLQEALTSDFSVTQLKKEIRKEFKTTSWRAECIARSETQKTYNQSSRLAIKNSAVTDQYQWETSHLESVCPICRPLDGRIYNVNDKNSPMPVESTHPNCLIDGQVQILTVGGYKQIRHIKVGELVMTKEGKFRKVTKTFNDQYYDGEVVTIGLPANGSFSVTFTANHPIMTDQGWVNAGDLTIYHKVYMTAKSCECCGKIFPVSVFENRFCGAACQNSYTAKKQWEEIGDKFTAANPINIRKWSLKRKRKLYNLEVEEFHNYIVKGLVVHNCNCRIRPYWEEAAK